MTVKPSDALAWIAVVAVAVTLGWTIASIGFRWDSAAQFLELTELLLSWKVITGALVVGAGVAFRNEIQGFITRH
jgi:hypothetical protein